MLQARHMLKLEDLISLALEAGREINAVRAAGFDPQTKLDGSIVTLADQRAEAIIEAGLARLAPGVPMIGEESCAEGRIPQCGARWFCVDPLDGTKGFAAGGDQFTVNIALIENGAPVIGVVYTPATGALYAGEPARALAGECDPVTTELRAPLRAIETARTPAQWRIIASENSGRDTQTAAFVRKLGGVAAHASSSIKFCKIADGGADLYPRFGEVSEWDAAAGHAILSAAGGGIMRLDGAALHYGDRDGDFIIKGFIAYSNEAAKQAALNALA